MMASGLVLYAHHLGSPWWECASWCRDFGQVMQSLEQLRSICCSDDLPAWHSEPGQGIKLLIFSRLRLLHFVMKDDPATATLIWIKFLDATNHSFVRKQRMFNYGLPPVWVALSAHLDRGSFENL